MPIIILWNGHMDKTILKRLGVDGLILNLTAYDELNNGIFVLKLINMTTGEIIMTHRLGAVLKLGRLLSLSETHSVVCGVVHVLYNTL